MARLKRAAVRLHSSSDASESDDSDDGYEEDVQQRKKRKAIGESKVISNEQSDESSSIASDSEDEAFASFSNRRGGIYTQDQQDYPQSGIIATVELINFMCHKHLKVDFGPSINFVIGHNGSGKSAILTAIIVCLGGKASVTQRATSLKSLVKEGESTASVTVSIKNEGDDERDCFKRNLYGDFIRIERRFSKDGTSSYRIKSANNVIVGRRREDLDEILDFFGLTVDNPMAILSQDTARSFLSNSTPEEKYSLFMKGIRLEELKRDYNELRECIDDTQSRLRAKKDALKELKEEAERAERKFEQTRNHRKVFENLRRLTCMYSWLHVSEAEKKLEDEDMAISDKEAELELALEEVDKAGVLCNRLNDEIENMRTTIESTRDQDSPIQDEINGARELIKDARVKLKDAHNDERSMIKHMEDLKEKYRIVLRKIEDEQKRLQNPDDCQRLELHNKQKEVEDKKTSLQSDLISELTEADRIKEEIEKKKKELEKIKYSYERKRSERSDIDKRIKDLYEYQKKYLSVFGNNIQGVLNAIEKEKRFQSKPVGPIGRYVRLKKNEWSPVLETFFGRTLESFAVTCKQDQIILNEILGKFKLNANIIIRRDEQFDYEYNVPDRSLETILDVLEMDNDYIKYVLIDLHGIERVILIANRARADEVMYRNPEKVYQCYALNERNPNNGFRVGLRKGASSTQPVYGRKEPPRMKTDIDLRLRSLQSEFEDIEKEMSNFSKEANQIEITLSDLRRKFQSAQTRIRNMEEDVQQMEIDLENIKLQLVSLDQTSNLPILEERLKDYEEQIKMHEESYYPAVITNKDNITVELNDLVMKLEQLKKELEKTGNDVAKLEEILHKLIQQKFQEENTLRHRQKQTDNRIMDIESLKLKREKTKEHLDTIRTAAQSTGDRIEADRGMTISKLQMLIQQITKEYKEAQRSLGATDEEIMEHYTETKTAYQRATSEIEDLADLLAKLSQTYRERLDRYIVFRSQICHRSKIIFRYTLELRGFTGRLYINHERETLHLKVQPTDTSKDGEHRNVKTLSGGEKSFTQICLLLALWDAMNCPIRGLDEFDVFMDAVNRRMSLTLMIDAARRSNQTQTIFITPQDMGSLQFGSDVKMIRMADPER
ncbi:P-loop containing nucleoside triphosphate hydrolase protein [Dipodascopsis uninucleata]